MLLTKKRNKQISFFTGQNGSVVADPGLRALGVSFVPRYMSESDCAEMQTYFLLLLYTGVMEWFAHRSILLPRVQGGVQDITGGVQERHYRKSVAT